MQSVSSRIWTRFAVSISYDDNNYTFLLCWKYSSVCRRHKSAAATCMIRHKLIFFSLTFLTHTNYVPLFYVNNYCYATFKESLQSLLKNINVLNDIILAYKKILYRMYFSANLSLNLRNRNLYICRSEFYSIICSFTDIMVRETYVQSQVASYQRL